MLVTPLAPRGDGSAEQASWHTTIIVAGWYWTLSSMQQIRQLPAAGPERPILLSFRNPPRFLGWSYRMWVGRCVARAVPVSRSRHRSLYLGIESHAARRAAAMAASQKQHDGE